MLGEGQWILPRRDAEVGSLTVSLATRVRGRLQGIVGRPIPWNPLSPEDVRKFQGIFQRPKFFIFGHARSGTTLLARLVRLHPDVHCNWQGRFVTHYGDLLDLMTSEPISQWLWHHSNHWREGISSEVALARAVIETIMEMEANRLGKSIVGDKTPNLRNAESVRRLHAVFPDAKLILIVRDGRDVMVSLRLAQFITRPHELDWQGRKIRRAMFRDTSAFLARGETIFTDAWLRKMAMRWRDNVDGSHREGLRRFGQKFFGLRYEDLLSNPVSWLARIWEFLGAEPEMVTPEEIRAEIDENRTYEYQPGVADAIVESLPGRGPGSWRHFFTHRDLEIFLDIAGPALNDFGYLAEDRGY